MSPRLRYSDRKRLTETGSLGDVVHESVPDQLAGAVRVIVDSAKSPQLAPALASALNEHFGRSDHWLAYSKRTEKCAR